jgi:hypothetical protein
VSEETRQLQSKYIDDLSQVSELSLLYMWYFMLVFNELKRIRISYRQKMEILLNININIMFKPPSVKITSMHDQYQV